LFRVKVLFVCKHNRFRSKVAEAIFKKFTANLDVFADSAGLTSDWNHNYVEPAVVKNMKVRG
jgi:protein-tyrosine-phosphatase